MRVQATNPRASDAHEALLAEPTAADWAATVTGTVTLSDVERHVLGLDEEALERNRDADAHHAGALSRAGRIARFTLGAVAVTGPLWAFTSILDRSAALTRAYDLPPSVEYPVIFGCLSATSVLLAGSVIRMLRTRQGEPIAMSFWFYFIYCGLLPLMTFALVESGPDTPPTWMLNPALACSLLGCVSAALATVLPTPTRLDDAAALSRLTLAYARQGIRRGAMSPADLEPQAGGRQKYSADRRELLLHDRRAALTILVDRGLLNADAADAAAALPLGEAIEP